MTSRRCEWKRNGKRCTGSAARLVGGLRVCTACAPAAGRRVATDGTAANTSRRGAGTLRR